MVEIALRAGARADGQTVYERLLAEELGNAIYRLLRSAAFADGVAKGDVIELAELGNYRVLEHAGLVVVRVIARGGISAIAATLGPALNSFDGEIEHEDERLLVFSVPASVGFAAIEAVMQQLLEGRNDAVWRYGNVYDNEGEPLNWWQASARS